MLISDKKCEWTFLKLAVYLFIRIIWHFDQIHMRTVRKRDFDFLTEWFYLVFRKTILTGQYVDRSKFRYILTSEPVNTPY